MPGQMVRVVYTDENHMRRAIEAAKPVAMDLIAALGELGTVVRSSEFEEDDTIAPYLFVRMHEVGVVFPKIEADIPYEVSSNALEGTEGTTNEMRRKDAVLNAAAAGFTSAVTVQYQDAERYMSLTVDQIEDGDARLPDDVGELITKALQDFYEKGFTA